MGLLMHDWLLRLYYELSALEVGLEKRSLAVDNDQNTRFSYYEKGKRIPGQASMIFIHGFSSDKEAWVPLMKHIPNSYHCILIDLPSHGETTDSHEDDHTLNEVIDKLKLFFDKMNLIKPMYLIGASIGGTVVSVFTTKYPQYVSLICLLAPPPIRKYESDLIRQLRSGMAEIILPETKEQLLATTDVLTVGKVSVPETFLQKYLKSRLRVLDQHKKILKSFLEYDYRNLEEYYERLKNNQCPVLILWGRQDQLCTVNGADYFSKLFSDSEVIIYDECGHFIAYEKTQETAQSIIEFLDRHSYDIIDLWTKL